MWFYYLVSLLALATVLISTYTDLKERIIPNKLTYPVIVIGVALYLAWGAYQRDWMFAVQGGLWAGLTFGIGYGMWFLGGWAGGDVKLYTALGALLGGYSAGEYSVAGAPYPLPLTVLLNGLLCLAPVLFIYTAVKSFKTPEIGKRIVQPIRDSLPETTALPFYIVGGGVLGSGLASYFNLSLIFQISITVVLIFLLYQMPLKFGTLAGAGLTVYGVYVHSFSTIEYLLMTFVAVFGITLMISVINAINREVLQEEISMDELKEDMVSAETIYEEDGKAKRYEGPRILGVLKQVLKNPTDPPTGPEEENVLADSSYAAGVSRYQVGELRRHVKEGNLEDHIRIRKSMPFAPSFGLGVPIAIFFGDIYWIIVQNVANLI